MKILFILLFISFPVSAAKLPVTKFTVTVPTTYVTGDPVTEDVNIRIYCKKFGDGYKPDYATVSPPATSMLISDFHALFPFTDGVQVCVGKAESPITGTVSENSKSILFMFEAGTAWRDDKVTLDKVLSAPGITTE